MQTIVRKYPFTSMYLLAFVLASLAVVWQQADAMAWMKSHGGAFDFNGALLKGISDYYHGTIYANIISIWWVAVHRNPVFFSVFLYGGAPTLAAIIIALIGWGPSGLKRLFLRLKPWSARAFRRDALVAYAVITGFFFLYALANVWIIAKYSGVGEVLNRTGVWGLPWYLFPITFLIGGFIDEGGTQEELGWRGFALPSLLKSSYSPLVVALGLGVLWWFWHFPREIPGIVTGPMHWAEFIYGQSMFCLLVMAMSVVMTFFFHRTGGSVIPGILLHGWGNFVTKDVGTYLIIKTDVRLYLWVAAAILLVVFSGPSLGRKRYLELRGPVDPNPLAD